MDVLASRTLIRSYDRERSQRFYRDVLGLAVSREFGDPAAPGVVFYAGGGFLEVSGSTEGMAAGAATVTQLWFQVRDVAAEHERLLAAGADVTREPRREPWGLIEMWLRDPDGIAIVLVEIPPDHPLRRDTRTL
jgi:predicted enzyme related to lactoylglutathione lyase